MNFYNTILNCKPIILIRKKSSNLGSPKSFTSIAFKFKNVNSMLFIYDYFMHNRLYCVEFQSKEYTYKLKFIYLRICQNYKLSNFTGSADTSISRLLMSTQPAGNQRVIAYTLVGSSETKRQLPDNGSCTLLNLFAIINFHMQKINHRCFIIYEGNSCKNKNKKNIFYRFGLSKLYIKLNHLKDTVVYIVLIVGFILLIVMINLILILLQGLLTGKGHLLLEL